MLEPSLSLITSSKDPGQSSFNATLQKGTCYLTANVYTNVTLPWLEKANETQFNARVVNINGICLIVALTLFGQKMALR